MKNGGEECNMDNDREILLIDSPRTGDNTVAGPYIVVAKNITERWAIVALDFNKDHRLGIRWFTGGNGSPISSAQPVWFLLPVSLQTALLDSLQLDGEFKEIISGFLNREEPKISSSELAAIGEIKSLFTQNRYDEPLIYTICYKQYDKLLKARNAEEREKEKNKCKEKTMKTERIFNEASSPEREERIKAIWQ